MLGIGLLGCLGWVIFVVSSLFGFCAVCNTFVLTHFLQVSVVGPSSMPLGLDDISSHT